MSKQEQSMSFIHENAVLVVKGAYMFHKAPKEFSDGELADHINMLREMKSLVEAREKLLTEALKARYNHQIALLVDDETLKIEGDETHGLMISNVTQKRFDSEAVKAEMGDEWWEEHCKTTSFSQMRTIRKG